MMKKLIAMLALFAVTGSVMAGLYEDLKKVKTEGGDVLAAYEAMKAEKKFEGQNPGYVLNMICFTRSHGGIQNKHAWALAECDALGITDKVKSTVNYNWLLTFVDPTKAWAGLGKSRINITNTYMVNVMGKRAGASKEEMFAVLSSAMLKGVAKDPKPVIGGLERVSQYELSAPPEKVLELYKKLSLRYPPMGADYSVWGDLALGLQQKIAAYKAALAE